MVANQRFEVGDKVMFTIKGITYHDTIEYVFGGMVEGRKHDLTNVPFIVI